MVYSSGFKARMLQRMVGPEGASATALSKEVGVAQATLSRWRQAARTVRAMGGKQSSQGGSRSPRQWTPEEKLRVVLKASELSKDELGAFIRQEGLHEAQLDEWRVRITQALAGGSRNKQAKTTPQAKQIRQLERELHRKEKALAELAALLALQKKAREIWGDGDDDTAAKNAT